MNENKKQMPTPDMGFELDLRKLLAAFVAQWKLIVFAGIVCAVLTFVYFNFFAQSLYTTNTVIMVLNKEKETGVVTNTDLTVSSNLSKDFIYIATSRTSLEEVDRRVGLDGAKVSASIIADTRQIKISVTHPDPEKAKEIADCVAEVASERICQIMDIPDMVRVVDKAFIPKARSYPQPTKYTGVAFIGGFLIAWLIVAIVFMSNDKINVAEDVEKYLDTSLLGVIPNYKTRSSDSGKRGTTHQRTKKK